MLLNSKFSNFVFSFPKKWIYPEIEEEFAPFFKRLPFPYRTCTDYINATVQSISWPSIDVESVSQVVTQRVSNIKRGVGIDGRRTNNDFVSGYDMALSMTKDFSVIFKTTEGFLNYFIMHRQFERFLAYGENNRPTMGHAQLQILDQHGYLIMTRTYNDIIMTGLTEIELSYASTVPEFRTFSINMKHNGCVITSEKQ